MVLVTKEIEIDLGHRVFNHKSKCRNLHGHRYKIELGCDDKVITEKGLSNEGMVIDFSDMKEILIKVIDAKFDHGFVMCDKDPMFDMFKLMQNGYHLKQPNKTSWLEHELPKGLPQNIHFVPFIPTAENLAKYWFELLLPELEKRFIQINHVKVWETPTSSVIYTINNYIKNG